MFTSRTVTTVLTGGNACHSKHQENYAMRGNLYRLEYSQTSKLRQTLFTAHQSTTNHTTFALGSPHPSPTEQTTEKLINLFIMPTPTEWDGNDEILSLFMDRIS